MATMDYQYILAETRQHVRYVTLNRLEKLNALLHEMIIEILDAAHEAVAEPNVEKVRAAPSARAGTCPRIRKGSRRRKVEPPRHRRHGGYLGTME